MFFPLKHPSCLCVAHFPPRHSHYIAPGWPQTLRTPSSASLDAGIRQVLFVTRGLLVIFAGSPVMVGFSVPLLVRFMMFLSPSMHQVNNTLLIGKVSDLGDSHLATNDPEGGMFSLLSDV